MNYKPGMIVRSKAGHDKDHVYVIIRVEKNYLYLDYYTEAGVLREVDGTIDINDVFAAIVQILGE